MGRKKNTDPGPIQKSTSYIPEHIDYINGIIKKSEEKTDFSKVVRVLIQESIDARKKLKNGH